MYGEIALEDAGSGERLLARAILRYYSPACRT